MLKIGLIGYGGMGVDTAAALEQSPDWDLVAIAERDQARLTIAAEQYPQSECLHDGSALIRSPGLDAVAITTMAGVRPDLIRQALAAELHIWAEKPLGGSTEDELALLEDLRDYPRHVAVNIFNRNAWYHETVQDFITDDQIGQVAVVRVRHQTPGRLPGPKDQDAGTPFESCGMHYLDVARWYAKGEFSDWHAQGICLWGQTEPWWVDVHGRFDNDVVFSVTNGFIHGQEAERRSVSCGLEVIGSRGVVTLSHDFHTVTCHLHGVDRTETRTGPYGGKNLDVLARRLAEAIRGGEIRYPRPEDAIVASVLAREIQAAARHNAPTLGDPSELATLCARHQQHSSGP